MQERTRITERPFVLPRISRHVLECFGQLLDLWFLEGETVKYGLLALVNLMVTVAVFLSAATGLQGLLGLDSYSAAVGGGLLSLVAVALLMKEQAKEYKLEHRFLVCMTVGFYLGVLLIGYILIRWWLNHHAPFL